MVGVLMDIALACASTTLCGVWVTSGSTFNLQIYIYTLGSRERSVGIATRYGLEGPGVESRWGRDFPHQFRPALEPTQPLYNGYRVFPGGKAAGTWR